MKTAKEKRGVSLLATLNLWVIAVVLCTAVIISFVYYYYIIERNRQSTLEKFQQSFSQAHMVMDGYLKEMVIAAAALSADPAMTVAINLSEKTDSLDRFRAGKQIRSAFAYMVNLNASIRDIALYTENAIYRYSDTQWMGNFYAGQIMAEPWFRQLREGDAARVFIPEYPVTPQLDLYLYAMAFYNRVDGDEGPRNVVLLSLNSDRIHQAVKSADIKESTIICLLNEEGSLLYSTYAGLPAAFVAALPEVIGYHNAFETDIDGERYYIVKETSRYSGWHLVSFTKSRDFFPDYYFIQPTLVLILVLITISSATIFVVILNSIIRPLRELVRAMDSSGGRKPGEADLRTRYTEIEKMRIAFNSMNRRIAQYIDDIRQKEKQRRIAELQTLEAQINPHFIYNTLDAIKWVAVLNNAGTVTQMISSFSRLLQISLAAGRERITLREELEHVRHYVDLMQYRYNAQVDIRYNAPEDVQALYTMKLIIQPIVENCLLHAFDLSSETGVVDISCHISDGMLIILVEDDGKGIGELAPEPSKRFSGVGVRNIDERIKLCFGPEYGVTIRNRAEGGTTATICQPIMREGEFDQ